MYPEFVPIYVGLLIIIILLVVILILLITRTSNMTTGVKRNAVGKTSSNEAAVVVFCKNCATQFDVSQQCCPKCGMPR